jgi:hypothetical protein
VKYGIEMVSDGMMYILSFMNIDSGTQKLVGGKYTDIQQGDLISLLYFFKIRKVC